MARRFAVERKRNHRRRVYFMGDRCYNSIKLSVLVKSGWEPTLYSYVRADI